MKTFEEFKFSIPHNKVKSQYTYAPKTKMELIEAIKAEIKLQGPEADLNCIDTSEITDMSCLFSVPTYKYTKNFNGDISNWNVSNVINMSYMFEGSVNFNQDISGWDVSNVKNMDYMFGYAESFNQNISGWNTNKVKIIYNIFDYCPIKKEFKPKFN